MAYEAAYPASWADFIDGLPDGAQKITLATAWQDSPALRVLWAYHVDGVRFAREMERRGVLHSVGARRILKRHGVLELCGNPHRGVAERYEAICRMSDECRTGEEIMAELGISRTEVRYSLDKRAGKPVGRGRRRANRGVAPKERAPWSPDECEE